MKASNLIKSMTALSVLSTALLAGGAQADYFSVSYGDFDGDRVQYRYVDRDGRHQYRDYDGHDGYFVDRIQAEQRERIHQGIRSGELTPREAARLQAEQREIEHLQRMYMADGRLGPHERRHLVAELDDASRHIWRQKHDAQDRYDYRPHWPHGYR